MDTNGDGSGIACIGIEGARSKPVASAMNIVRRSQGLVHTIRFLQPSPSSMFLLKILIALVALLLMASVRGETNVTIDDTDPQIVYYPPDVWSFQGNVRLSFVQDRGHSLIL